MKFSGSINRNGLIIIIEKINNVEIKPIISFQEKYGWNGNLSMLEFNPIGFEDPVSWRKIK
jgi:hypothetical protein